MKLLLILLVIVLLGAVAATMALQMPGRSYRGAPAPADASVADELRRDVVALASGSRSTVTPEALRAAAAHIEKAFADAGLRPSRQTYAVEGVECARAEGRPLADVVVRRVQDGEVVASLSEVMTLLWRYCDFEVTVGGGRPYLFSHLDQSETGFSFGPAWKAPDAFYDELWRHLDEVMKQ